MTPQEIRLELLRLCMPAVANPDVQMALQKAKALEAYVMGAGYATEPPRHAQAPQPQQQVRNTQPVAGPARK